MALGLAVAALALPAAAAAAPSAPSALQVNATGPQQVALTWTASTSANLTGYHIYRNGSAIATTDNSSPNYVDQSSSLVNGTAYTYTVDAYDASGSSFQTSGVSGTPAAAFTFGTCPGTTAITPGHYKLTADLTAPASKPCFTFGTGSNLSLDCQGHTITQNSAFDLIDINGVDKFLLSHCVFQQNSAGGKMVVATGGSYGVFTDNTFNSAAGTGNQGASLDLDHSPHGVVGQIGHGNTFSNTYVEAITSPYTYEGYNTMSETGLVNPVGTYFQYGSDNSTAVHNHIDGGYPGVPAPNSGLDDGYLFDGPNDKLNVSYNMISNTFDAGIEPTSTITNSHFDYNTISNVAFAGIGEYHQTDFRNNTVIGNNVDHAPHVILFGVDGLAGITPASYNLSNNLISGNVFASPVAGASSIAAVDWTFKTSPTPPLSIGSTGNVFTNNDFGPVGAPPNLDPSGAAVYASSTGNYCQSSTSIQCIGKPIITAGTAPVRGGSGSYTLRVMVDASGADSTSTGIEFGTTTSYGSSATSLPVYRGTPRQIPIGTPVLTPGVTYHYRGVVTNAYGTTNGPDQTFTAS